MGLKDSIESLLHRLFSMKDGFGANKQGMTLLEVVVALMLLCVGVMGVAAMFEVSSKSSRKARNGVENTLAAVAVMEQVLALPYDDPQLEDADGAFDPQQPDHGPFDLGIRTATIEWEVHRDFPVPNTKRVLVTVRSKGEGNGFSDHRYDYVKARQLSFASIAAEDE